MSELQATNTIPEEHDIVIAGGSLAGLACAIRLKQLGHNPLVLEKAVFPREKLCGEFLGPDAFPVLERLGVFEAVAAAAFGPVERAEFHNRRGDRHTIALRWISPRYPYGLALPRSVLDTLLADHARELGIELRVGMRVQPLVPRKNDRFQLIVSPTGKSGIDAGSTVSNIDEYELNKPNPGPRSRIPPTLTLPRKGGGDFEDTTCETDSYNSPNRNSAGANRTIAVECRWLVDATGRNGHLTLSDGADGNMTRLRERRPPSRDWVGIQCHVTMPQAFARKDLQMFLFPGGYGGLQPIGPCTANLCMLVKAPLARLMRERFEHFVAGTIGRNPAALRMLSHVEKAGDFNTTADINLNVRRSNRKMLRIGDAFVTVDPFTGSGMAHALETGVLAAECLDAGIRGRNNYETCVREFQARYRRRFQLRLSLVRCFRPALDSALLQNLLWPVARPVLPALAKFFR